MVGHGRREYGYVVPVPQAGASQTRLVSDQLRTSVTLSAPHRCVARSKHEAGGEERSEDGAWRPRHRTAGYLSGSWISATVRIGNQIGRRLRHRLL